MADYAAKNPFLMESDYAPVNPMYAAPAPVESQSSNPFLSFGAPEPAPMYAQTAEDPMAMGMPNNYGSMGMGGGENPFLSYSYPTANDTIASAASAPSNPFADFAAPAPDPQMGMGAGGSGANAYFASTADMSYAHQTHETAAYYQPEPAPLIDYSHPTTHPTTQNLLESVTGALEATSDSLLDRLRSAPSPTVEMPSPTPSPRTPSPDLLLPHLGDEPPPVPPPSANPLAPSPHQLDSIIDLFDVPAGPKSSAEILGLYNTNTVTVTTAKPPGAVVQEVPAIGTIQTQPQEQIAPEPLVDLVIEPATPLVKNMASVDKPEVVTSPPNLLSPDQLQSAPTPEESHESHESKPGPPRPPSPSRSPVHSPIHEAPARPMVPPSPAKAGPPERPKPPPVPLPPKSPVLEDKPLPSKAGPPERPKPPPVPPAPRASPVPPPAVPPAPVPAPAAPVHPVQPPVPIQAFASEPQPPPLPSQPPPVPTQPAPVFSTFTSAPVPTQPFESAKPFTAAGSTGANIFGTKPQTDVTNGFDAFDAKFERLAESGASGSDPFGAPSITTTADSAWGSDSFSGGGDEPMGFGTNDTFDSFLSLTEPPPVPQSTPAKLRKEGDDDYDNYEDKDMSITIRPQGDFTLSIAPALAPPPKSPAISTGSAYSEDNNTAFVPFLSTAQQSTYGNEYSESKRQTQMNRTDSGETPSSPLFEEDTSQPLEDFPRTKYVCEGWEMKMRYPNKKKTFSGNRYWKDVFVRIGYQNEVPIVQIYAKKGDKEPLQEIPLQSSYSVSDISAQQEDSFGKIFTIKIQFVFYKERPGVRPGQIGKASRLSHKLSAFAAYAITGDPSRVKEFGSDLKKLGLPLEHAPQISELVKLGTKTYEDIKQFSICIEESLFTLPVHRDRALNYKTEEIQCTIVDEYFVEQDVLGVVTRQIARVRVMFLSFLNGIAEIEMGVNDLRRQGKEIVGRHDICPVPTEEWIRMESIEFSNIVQMEEFESTQLIKFKPPDASYLELMRFRVRPPKRRELPLQVKTTFITIGQRIEIRSDILVPGYTSRSLGQIPCEDVMVRFPIPESWIYMFRVEKHFRYGSVKSAHRRSGKVKGVERILGALDAVEPSLMETTSGQAKYEHHHRAIVWRISRLPKEGQGAYTTHSFFCHITLQAHEKIPDNLSKFCYVEFTMPHTTVSHTVCRSISVPTSDDPPEKCCRYLSRHEYIVEIEHREGMTQASYSIAAAVPEKKEEAPERGEFEETKYDSDFSDE